MAVDFGGRLKEYVVILSKVWTYMAELSGGGENKGLSSSVRTVSSGRAIQMGHWGYCLNYDRSLLP